MARRAVYAAQPYVRLRGALSAGEVIQSSDEDLVFRRGVRMSDRVAGVAFFKITSGPDGDQWTEVEMLCSTGDVPTEDAA